MKNKIALIGAGSTYTPELVDCFIKNYSEVPLSEIYLMDIDERKLNILSGLVKRMVKAANIPLKVSSGTDLSECLKNSSFVILQIRVEGLKARHRDETVPLEFGCIGQETTGAGGFACAVRTIPAVLDICKEAEKICPESWIINFTNPSGIITEALNKYSSMKVIGLCNIPAFIKRKIADVFQVPSEEVDFDYIGLNHLSWLTGIRVEGKDVLESMPKELIKLANLPEFPISEEVIKTTGFIPSPYLKYYYHHDKMLEEQRKAEKTRAEIVMKIEEKLLNIYSDKKLNQKPALLEERGGACYSEAAFSIISSIINNKRENHIVNIPNKGILKELPSDAVIEASVNFSSEGYKIMAEEKEIPVEIKSLIQSVKTYESLTVESAVRSSRKLAHLALLSHPLIGQYEKVFPLLEKLIKSNKFSLM